MIPLAIAFTPNYFVQAATLLRSVLDASPNGRFRVVCLLSEDIPDRMKDKLAWLDEERLALEFIPLKGRLKDVYIDPRYTEAASLRLLLPELLPELDRILYLDCDIIVRHADGEADKLVLGGCAGDEPADTAGGTIPNLYCVGRNGQHRYNNIDHSMVTSFEAVKAIKSGTTDKSALWNVNTEMKGIRKNDYQT